MSSAKVGDLVTAENVSELPIGTRVEWTSNYYGRVFASKVASDSWLATYRDMSISFRDGDMTVGGPTRIAATPEPVVTIPAAELARLRDMARNSDRVSLALSWALMHIEATTKVDENTAILMAAAYADLGKTIPAGGTPRTIADAIRELARLREIERCAKDIPALMESVRRGGAVHDVNRAQSALHWRLRDLCDLAAPSPTDPPAAFHGSIPHDTNGDVK